MPEALFILNDVYFILLQKHKCSMFITYLSFHYLTSQTFYPTALKGPYGVENYFPRLWCTGISRAIFLLIKYSFLSLIPIMFPSCGE